MAAVKKKKKKKGDLPPIERKEPHNFPVFRVGSILRGHKECYAEGKIPANKSGTNGRN